MAVGDGDVGGVKLGGGAAFPLAVVVAIEAEVEPLFEVEGFSVEFVGDRLEESPSAGVLRVGKREGACAREGESREEEK